MPARRLYPFRPTLLALVVTLALAACKDSGRGGSGDGGAAMAAKADDAKDGGITFESKPADGDAGATDDDTAMPLPPPRDELTGRMKHLLEAIAQNNAALASDILFPRDAYVASRDTADPQKAWERKLSGAFRRAVERTHRRTKGVANAKFVGFELGHAIVQITPKKRDFKKPLWRVKQSKLTYSVDGETRHISIAEMTAWRGAWYITRLR